MKRNVKGLRVIKAIHMLVLGCQIEIMRKHLEIMIHMQKTFSSESVVKKSNELSRLGIKYMSLSTDTQSLPIWEL